MKEVFSRRVILIPVIFTAVAIIATAVYFIYSNVTKVNTGSPVDHNTYIQIQSLMFKTDFDNPEVIENSLRYFDIDKDGDKDVVGILKYSLPFLNNSVYIFATWFRNGSEYKYYQDSYYNFRFGGKYYRDRMCSIADLAVKRVTIDCIEKGEKKSFTLRYQENGVGYYRDIDAYAVTFKKSNNWQEYISKNGGIQFNHPSNVNISEKTYRVDNDLITVIKGERNDKTLLEISSSMLNNKNAFGNEIGNGQNVVFLKLTDGSYLLRNWMGVGPEIYESGIFYRKVNAYSKNNSGSIRSSQNPENIENNRVYTLFAPIMSENNLKEIDNIFASIKYVDVASNQDEKTVPLKSNNLSLLNIATLQLPGNISEKSTPINQSNIIDSKDIEVSFINSLIYRPTNLILKLYRFGLVGTINIVGGGGVYPEKNSCFDFNGNIITSLQKIEAYQVCKFGSGGEDGYYVLDPNKKYILSIAQKYVYGGEPYIMFNLDLDAIVKSVRFSTQ